jgi:hypothetical protein
MLPANTLRLPRPASFVARLSRGLAFRDGNSIRGDLSYVLCSNAWRGGDLGADLR